MTPLTLTATDARPGLSKPKRTAWVPTLVLILGSLYCLIPVVWVVIAASKGRGELFSTFTFAPGSGFADNFKELSSYRDGIYWQWMANSLFYAGFGALLSAAVSAAGGYALGRFAFRGREFVFKLMLAGVLVPSIVLTVPQYLLLSKMGLADSYWSMLLPSILSPYGVYLVRIYAAASVPNELLEAARMDGASEWRIFSRIAVPMMMPGLITVFLFQFVGIWNNFLLPFVMLADDTKFPITLGLYTLLNQGASQPALYTLVIMGCFLAILPLIALFLVIQRFWSLDLLSGSVKA
ncbi:carbohydrate ABC transporter permease [Streptomyces sp. N50]|uniref:carbohydrate ABC transporter permease n=1 Tax=Streptomyces sp. N50 TaxID=3081765 RepID=UPI0029620B55|nr:carbohydrate ABC transporter permease [Streptomyces sp. N50]WOX11752.1 carbohydrate ABC transporter permease [Streptomyces sp. N50]